MVENYQKLNEFFDQVLDVRIHNRKLTYFQTLKGQREIVEVVFSEYKVMVLETLISETFSKAIQGFVQSVLTTSLSNLDNSPPAQHCDAADIYLSTLAHSILKVR